MIPILGFILFLFSAFLPNAYSLGEYVSRDAYVSAGISDARILVPFLADDVSSSSICNLVYSGLTKVNKNLNVVGDLAESWDIEEDGKAITFHLRKGVLWHDGTLFTAEDVKFTFTTILDPAQACPYISNYSDITSMEVIDQYTIRFRYNLPYAPALFNFGMGIIPKHLFEGVKDIRKSSYARSPIGTGPYQFTKWESGDCIVLEANPNYYKHIPGIKRYVYKVIPDQAVEFLELVSGGIDAMDLNPYQFRYRSSTKEFSSRIQKYKYLDRSYTYIGYNLKDPLFLDVKVRKALSYAIDKKEIIDAVLYGLGEPCTGPFFKGTPYYDETADGYDYNPSLAAKLLKEAGWEDSDKDGVLDKSGEKFRFTMVTNQGNQVREDAAVIIQSHWAKLGIKADIRVVAWSAFLNQFIDKKNFQAVILGWTLPVDPDSYVVWHSNSIEKGGLNFVSYSNPEVDELIEMGRREFNPAVRRKIYRRIHEIIAQDAPYTFLYFPYALPAEHKRFSGIEPAPAGIGYNFIDWYVPRDKVKYKF